MRVKYIGALALMGCVGGATFTIFEGKANAYWERIHPSICSPMWDDQTNATFDNGLTYVYSEPAGPDSTLHNRNLGVGYFICPVPDNSSLPKGAITRISVRVYDGNTIYGVSAKACTTDSSGTGGVCGTTVTSSVGGMGYSSLVPGVSALDDESSDRAYLWIMLPPPGTANSQLVGLYFEDING